MADSDWLFVKRNKTTGQYKTDEEGGGGGGSSTLAGLTDVNLSSPSDGQVLKYDAENDKWVNEDESGGTVTDVLVDDISVVNAQGEAEIPAIPDKFDDLSDVQFSNLLDHQPLRYDATLQKWRNGADSFPPLIYSDEEREVGVWRDGKPLYQKTIIIDLTSSNVGNYVSFAHNISNIDSVINAYGNLFQPVNGAWYNRLVVANISSASSYINAPYSASFIRADKTDVAFAIGGSLYSGGYTKAAATIQYTKTTDTPGSGTWTTQGAIAHHYSTNEQIIGTWIDGKPLYEKTLDLGSSGLTISYNSWTTSNIPKAGIEVVVYARATNQTGSAYFGDVMVSKETDNTYISFQTARNNNNTEVIRYVTLQYTKTTDV